MLGGSHLLALYTLPLREHIHADSRNGASRQRQVGQLHAVSSRTSRLGCQITMTDELDGLTVALPNATRNMMVDKA